ncbi:MULTISPECIES: TetR/AcrR family transcriptional regulator [Arthrobacter]|jgi:AcrR family transcriptional regulator|uniref:AcrR family transcriptional regulator n=1 Tax=Arthrobacter bambusae TaxID=1338426 RepID=A0AAW8DJ66_9MICC|nr:TetR/AcrR family transcriptional regulator [Arthrobacter bambusae]MDP9905499.1 AcrR family transcriptional regulator [Arthrobacter bambusae]MDQ0127419.1 AcrR family transcriptional regulator [Arthrobacter bambusae]MDQ0178761.1 AcrR family transcriptional regulator [Arthrobacter bambusae]
MPEAAETRTRGPYRTGVRRREQLIGIAMDVFGEHGFAGGSLRTIAEQAGVNHATLIQHFGSKEGLLTAVLEEWDRRTVENGLIDVSGLDYFRRLPEVMAAHRDNRGLLELFTTIAAEASSPAHPGHAFITQRYTSNLATLAGHLQEAVEAGDIVHLSPAQIEIEVRLFTAVMDGMGLQWLLDPETDIHASVTTYVERAIAAWGGR